MQAPPKQRFGQRRQRSGITSVLGNSLELFYLQVWLQTLSRTDREKSRVCEPCRGRHEESCSAWVRDTQVCEQGTGRGGYVYRNHNHRNWKVIKKQCLALL